MAAGQRPRRRRPGSRSRAYALADGAGARARARGRPRAGPDPRPARASATRRAARASWRPGSPTTPSAFTGIDARARADRRHIAAGGRIIVHGDYDVDGVCATAILVRALRGARAPTSGWFLPEPARGRLRALAGHRRAAGRPRGTRAARHRRLRDHRGRGGRRRRAPPGSRWSSPTTTPRAPTACFPDCPIVHPGALRLPVRRAVRDGGRLQAGRRRSGRRTAARGPRARRAGHGRRPGAAVGREPPAGARGPGRAGQHRQARACGP